MNEVNEDRSPRITKRDMDRYQYSLRGYQEETETRNSH